MKLKDEIEELIASKSEGSYWDFKQSWHENIADLLKDIICMANNTTNDMRDGYIIFGVEDKTFEILDIIEDKNRKNQENIIGFLSSQVWSGEEMPIIKVKTIEIKNKYIDVLIIYNSAVTPYYLLKDYSKSFKGKNKVIIHSGVIYSRIGDRNTSSAECATKQATEFLWKKRFGLIGTDSLKISKRLKNINQWYSVDEKQTYLNSEYDDIVLKLDSNYKLEVNIEKENHNTYIWMMDFPYLFTDMLNWNIGVKEIGTRLKWDIILNNRQVDFSLFGVQGTRQSFCHIEPNIYWESELGISLNKISDTIKYYAYTEDSIEFLAFKLFFNKQCYQDKKLTHDKIFKIIPLFKSEQERLTFIKYLRNKKNDFRNAVEKQSVNEVFPEYAQFVDSIIIYKFCKTMVEWLNDWKINNLK